MCSCVTVVGMATIIQGIEMSSIEFTCTMCLLSDCCELVGECYQFVTGDEISFSLFFSHL